MNWFTNLKTRTKLIIGFGAMIAFLAAIIFTGYDSIRGIQQSQTTLFDMDSALTLDMVRLENNFNEQRAIILTMMTLAGGSDMGQLQQDLKDTARENDEVFKRASELRQSDAKFSKIIADVTSLRNEYKETRDTLVIPAIIAGKAEEAKAQVMGIQRERYLKIRGMTQELGNEAQERAREALKLSERRADQSVIMFVVMGGLAILTAIIMVVLLNRIIAAPLQEISRAAERIAVGDLSVSMSGDNRLDEVGVLAQTFSRMTTSLQGMAAVAQKIAACDLRVKVEPQSDKDMLGTAFASMVATLQTLTSDITEAVNVLGSSANEISASTTQFAASATEAAAAVTETTTTVEEIRQTAQVSSQKTKQVSEASQRTVQISQAGKKSTEQTTEGMSRIREQMDLIAESMVKLSEQTQAVGQIISTVDDLAQQSNLLAVNASIEAAKAGEQGKGFAVVAQEVKSLADQSKQATAQVRTILSDIQKATNAAVMATEQGGKAVQSGVQQSSQAGESIVTLASSIGEAAQAASQIAASSQQQLIGMDQVALAIENIKKASGQNVESARQLETAARNLSDLGRKLRDLVGRFKV